MNLIVKCYRKNDCVSSVLNFLLQKHFTVGVKGPLHLPKKKRTFVML